MNTRSGTKENFIIPSTIDINTTEVPIDPNATATKHINLSPKVTDDHSYFYRNSMSSMSHSELSMSATPEK